MTRAYVASRPCLQWPSEGTTLEAARTLAVHRALVAGEGHVVELGPPARLVEVVYPDASVQLGLPIPYLPGIAIEAPPPAPERTDPGNQVPLPLAPPPHLRLP